MDPRRRRRLLRPEELALWHANVRDAVPLRPSDDVPMAEAPAPEPVPAVTARDVAASAREAPPHRPASPPPPRASRRLDPHRAIDMDARTWQRLQRGLMPINGRLDLHGLTQAAAHDELDRFLAQTHAAGKRCILVITGRGLASGGGILREMTPRWLDTSPNRERVLAYAQAQIRHGGAGALYVLLKRLR